MFEMMKEKVDAEKLLLEKVSQLYEEGSYGQVILAIVNEFSENLSMASPEILEKLSWAYYRHNNFGAALEIVMLAEKLGYNNLKPIRVQIEAYVNGNIDKALEVLDDGGSDDPRVCNAFIVAARKQVHPDVYIEQALDYVRRHKESVNISAIHMQNNMGRLYLVVGDFESAIDCFGRAYARYGEGNFHHRAALIFWVSKAYQEMVDISAAIEAIEKCQNLWRLAIDADPENGTFLANLSNADKTYLELVELQTELEHL